MHRHPLPPLPAVALAALGLILLVAAGPPEPTESVEEIVECISSNVPEGDDLRAVTLVTKDRAGAERVVAASVLGRRTPEGGRNLLVTFTRPEELEGSALLLLQTDEGREAWMHTPELGRRKLLTGEGQPQNLFGTGMTYSDFMHLVGLVQTESKNQKLVGGDLIEGLPAYVLESRPLSGGSDYERIVSWVDRDTCVLLKVELYERADGKPRKIITTNPDQIFPVGNVWVAHSMTLDDLRDGKQTTLHLESVFRPAAVPDLVYLPESLGKYKPKIEIEIELVPIDIKPELMEPMQ